MRELAVFFGCEPSEAAVYEHRLGRDPVEYAADLLRATGTELLLVDDGFPPPGEGVEWEELGALAGCRARPVLRLERVGEEALGGSFPEFRERVRAEVGGARARGFAALKTIAAYRTGLDVGLPDVAAAEVAFAASGPRLDSKPPPEPALWDALQANEPDPLPLQVHPGFG